MEWTSDRSGTPGRRRRLGHWEDSCLRSAAPIHHPGREYSASDAATAAAAVPAAAAAGAEDAFVTCRLITTVVMIRSRPADCPYSWSSVRETTDYLVTPADPASI